MDQAFLGLFPIVVAVDQGAVGIAQFQGELLLQARYSSAGEAAAHPALTLDRLPLRFERIEPPHTGESGKVPIGRMHGCAIIFRVRRDQRVGR